MTDEEKAEEYVRNKADEGNFDLEQFGKAYFSESSMKQAFLAGLKTGREIEKEYVKNNAFTSMKEQGLFPFDKWHYMEDGVMPRENQWVLVYDGSFTVCNYHSNTAIKWLDNYENEVYEGNIIAWKEIGPLKECEND